MPQVFHLVSRVVAVTVLLLAVEFSAFSQTDDVTSAIAGVSSGDRNLRYKAVYTLCVAKDDPRSTEPLIGALDDLDDVIREMAVTCLGSRKDTRAVYSLIRLINDKNQSVGWAAARALGNIGDTAAVEPLIEALNRSDSGCNYPVVQALASMNDRRVTMPLFSQVHKGCGESAIPKAKGAEAVEQISQIIIRGSPTERHTAVWALGYIADEGALDALISVLGKDDGRISNMAGDTIAFRIGAVAIEPLTTTFKQGDIGTKKAAARTLTKIDDAQIADILSELVTASDVTIRREIVHTLAASQSDHGPKNKEAIFSAILTAMNDKDPEVRILAIRSLLLVETDGAFQALINALSDPATSAEASLVVGIRRDTRALPHLLKGLRGTDPSLAARASYILTAIGEPAIEGLISVLTDNYPEFQLREIRRQQEKANITYLFPRCGNEPSDPILDPRVLAANALGEIGDERARKPLVVATRDKASWLRDAALAALERLDRRKPVGSEVQ